MLSQSKVGGVQILCIKVQFHFNHASLSQEPTQGDDGAASQPVTASVTGQQQSDPALLLSTQPFGGLCPVTTLNVCQQMISAQLCTWGRHEPEACLPLAGNKTGEGGLKIAHPVKCLLLKHGDLSQSPVPTHKCQLY